MSLTNMAVKLALAFAAAKGVDAFRKSGGMAGVRQKLEDQRRGQGASGDGGGGLGGLLGGLAGGSGRSGGGGGLGGLLGGLAGAAGGTAAAGRMQGLMDTTRPNSSVDDEVAAGLMIRAMVQAAHADGHIDPDEERQIAGLLDEDDPNDTAFLQRCLDEPVDAQALARDVPEGLEIEVYTASVVAIEPDNRAEAEHLNALAVALHLDKATVNDIHKAQGKPPLYTL